MDDVEVVAQREVLVDDLDAERVGLLRAVDGDRLALEEHLAARRTGGCPAIALDQRALAGAVVADERGHLPGVDVEVDAVQHVHGAEALVDPPQGQQRLSLRCVVLPSWIADSARAMARLLEPDPARRCRPASRSRRCRRDEAVGDDVLDVVREDAPAAAAGPT